MSDIQTTDWSETAANNNVTPPAGWPEGQAPSTVNDCAREMMGAVKRDWNRSHTTISSTGTSTAFVLTYTTAPPAYVNGLRFSFKANAACGAAATANVNSLGAKSIYAQSAVGVVAVVGGEWQVNHHVTLEYDLALDVLVLVSTTTASTGAVIENFLPSQQSTPNMTVLVNAGSILIGTALTKVAAQNTATFTAPVVNPRNDIVYIDQTTGVVGVAAGTPAVTPADPAVPSGKLPICRVRLQITTTAIINSLLDDLRQLPIPAVAQVPQPPIRQTVLSGPLNTDGSSNFGGSTGSTTVTASGTLVVTAAQGFSSTGPLDRIGSIANPQWTNLNNNGTTYLGLQVNADGTCSVVQTPVGLAYPFNSTPSVSNGQFTFNQQQMIMYLGNGSVATPNYYVFVGEVTIAGGVVTAITWYNILGQYASGYTNTLPGANSGATVNHRLGLVPGNITLQIKNLTAEFGFTVGSVVSTSILTNNGTAVSPIPVWATSLQGNFKTGSSTAFAITRNDTGAQATLTAANWAYQIIATRGW